MNEMVKPEADVDAYIEVQDRLANALLTVKTEDGEVIIKRCVSNAMALMKHHPDWEGVLAFNEFTRRPMLTLPIPGSAEDNGTPFPGRAIEDEDVTDARAWFDRNLPGMAKQDVIDAFNRVLKDSRADPLKQYIEEVMAAWDGKERLPNFFDDYFVAEYEKDAYSTELGIKAVMTQVLRGLYPGAFQKMIPILEGKQNIGKSTGLKAMSPDPSWFTDNLHEDLNGVRTSMALRGKFIVELAELDALNRREMSEIKAFGSREVENFTPLYGRYTVEEPRRCMFWGTVNKSGYLRDETGASRFYPIKIIQVNVDAIRHDRDQLLGEAAHRLVKAIEAGEAWWEFSPEAMAILKQTRDEKGDVHVWTPTVLKFVEDREVVALQAILQDQGGLGFNKKNLKRGHSDEVARILQKAGWESEGQITSGPYKGTARYVLGDEARAERQSREGGG